MNYFRRLTGSAMALMTMAALSVGAFAADYSFETGGGTEYYPATSYADTYGAAYNYGGPNLVDYQIPELPYGSFSTTQIGVMEKVNLPGLQQSIATSPSGNYGISDGIPAETVFPVKPSVPAYTSVDGKHRHPENSIPGHQHEGLGRRNKRKHEKGTGALQLHLSVGRQYRRVRP